MFPFVLWELLRFPTEIYVSCLVYIHCTALSPTAWMGYDGDKGNLAVIQEHITCSCSEISPSILMQTNSHFQINHASLSVLVASVFHCCVDLGSDLCEN